jgi:trimeric autotransporter adhesin
LRLGLLGLIFLLAFLCVSDIARAQIPADGSSQPTAASLAPFVISGTVRAGKTPLPGVTVTAANSLTGKKVVVATNLNGAFQLDGLPRGRYVVKVEFMGFATETREVLLNPENPSGRLDLALTLASRQQDSQSNVIGALSAAGRGFQSLAVAGALSALAGDNAAASGAVAGQPAASELGSLPMSGVGAEGPTESVSISGTLGRTQDFGSGSEDDLQERIQEFRERAQREGGGFGGPGGPGGAAGGPMVFRMPRNFNINQPHGVLYFQDDTSELDARPYSLNGEQLPKADYNQTRFGAYVGGPLNIPKIFDGGNKTFFFGGYNGTRGGLPYDAFSTVPTVAERNGIFSGATYKDGTPVTIFDPQTGQPFVNNTIDPSRISTAAKDMLAFIPLPNLNTATQNFHYVTTQDTSSDSVSFRLIHNFGQAGFGPFGGGGRGGGGGGGGRSGTRNNLNFGMNYSRSSTAITNPFPSLAGNTNTQGLNASAGWVYGKGRANNNLRFNYNHNHVSTNNLFSGVTNVAGLAGIAGVSTDPFDWGIPGISFTSFGGLVDPTPRRELDQTFTASDTLSWGHGKHNWRFGGDYRRILQSFRSARNAEGSFVFTGFATSQILPGSTQPVPDTGYDFADFLLGLPQQTTLQSGASSYNFRANSFDVFAQDDWRLKPTLSLNLGLRYEYNGPYTEANNQIANLVVGPGFTSAQPIVPSAAVLPAGATGLLQSGNPSLINPDRNDFAPRIGIAWRPVKDTVIRAGYGINYNLAQYGAIIQNFAFQPPFAITATNVSQVGSPTLTLANGFPSAPQSTTNNFAVDPNYRLGYVQVWNLDIQRTLPGNWLLNVGYNGSKGSRLDVERAIVVANAQPFIYESSAADSIYHGASVRIRKRMSHGLGLSASYVYSKSIDDASSIGGGATVVSQNPFDIAADRGLSTFDQRHKFTGNWIYDLPFGDGHRWATKGALSHILGGWQYSGDFTVASGFYFTPRVLGGTLDINRGVSGSLRANYLVGQPIALANPTTAEWFNTAAFCAPGLNCVNPAGSSFGDAGRNIIEGPGQFALNMVLSKTITIRESRALELRLQALNVLNAPVFASINTAVNSITFGQVTSVSNMRRITMIMRFRF